jgi:hypothetical protein
MAQYETIWLSVGDRRLGEYDAEGGVVNWPQADLFGAPYEKRVATLKRLTARWFVVLGPRADDPNRIIVVNEEPRAASADAPRFDGNPDGEE